MQNYATSTEATTTALNSQGSAMRENEQYLQSFEARLNKLSNSWTTLVLELQDAIIGDGLITFTEGMTSLTKGTANFVKEFGILPPLFGIVTLAVLTFSKAKETAIARGNTFLTTMRAMPATIRTTSASLAAATLAQKTFATATNVTTSALTRMATIGKTAGAFLFGAFPQVALFMGVGYAISFITEKVADQAQTAKELREETDKLTRTYASNEVQIQGLIGQYEELSNIRETTGLTNEQEETYLNIQNELGQILPQIVDNIDQKGQMHLKSADAIKEEVKHLKELSDLEDLAFINNFSDQVDDITKKLSATRFEMHKLAKPTQSIENGKRVTTERELTPEESIQQLMMQREVNALNEQAIQLANRLSESYANQLGYRGMLNQADRDHINTYIEQNSVLLETEDGIVELDNQIKQYVITLGDVRLAVGDAFTTEEIMKFSDEQRLVFANISDAIRNGNTDWESFRNQIESVGLDYEQVVDAIVNGNNEMVDSVGDFAVYYDQALTQPVDSLEALHMAIEEGLDLFDAQGNKIDENSEAFNELTNAIDSNTDSKYQNIDATDALFGVTSSQISQMENAIQTVMLLSQMENLNEQQKGHLSNAIAFLSGMFPHLNGKIAENIDWLFAEIQMMQAVGSASANMAKASTTNQNATTRAAVGAVNERIAAYQKEADALDRLMNYRNQIVRAIAADDAAGREVSPEFMRLYASTNVQIHKAQLQMASYAGQVVSAVDHFNNVYKASGGSGSSSGGSGSKGGSGGSRGKSGSGSSSKSPSSSSKSAQEERQIDRYETDKFTQSMDNLSLRIEQSEYRMGKLNETSKSYRQELSNQINLYKQQQKLVNDEIKRLEKRNSALQRQLKSMGSFNKLNAEGKELYNQVKKEIDDNIKSINSLRSQHMKLSDTIRKTQDDIKRIYESFADEVIQLYKEVYEKQRELALKANDDEMKALEKSHRRKKEMLDEELSQYEEIINAKLKQLDQEQSEEDYQKQLAEKQKARQELLTKINLLSMDDSLEARRKVSEMTEQLAGMDADIEEFMRKRALDLRKQSLQEELEAVRERVNAEKEIEDEKYEAEREKLEQQRETINRHYENLLNDERAFAKMREDILNGNIKNISKDLKNFTTEMSRNMSTLGESITQNLIDKLREATNVIKQLDKSHKEYTGAQTKSSSSGSSSSSSSKSSSSSGSSSGSSSSKTSASSLPLRKKNGGFATPPGNWDKNSVVDYLKSKGYYADFSDRDALFKALKGSGIYTGTNSQNNWLLKQLKNVTGLKSGGYVDWDGNGGKLAFLHKKELVLNKDDTTNFLKGIHMLRDMKDMILNPIVKIPQQPQFAGQGQSNSFRFDKLLNIENFSGTKNDYNKLNNNLVDMLEDLGVVTTKI